MILPILDPTTCAGVGITECCTDPEGASCDVFNSTSRVCSCNVSCHLRNDCCSDAINICPRKPGPGINHRIMQWYDNIILLFNTATTCSEARKPPGCCISNPNRTSCHVQGGNCYCDSQCVHNRDCCVDVPLQCGESILMHFLVPLFRCCWWQSWFWICNNSNFLLCFSCYLNEDYNASINYGTTTNGKSGHTKWLITQCYRKYTWMYSGCS